MGPEATYGAHPITKAAREALQMKGPSNSSSSGWGLASYNWYISSLMTSSSGQLKRLLKRVNTLILKHEEDICTYTLHVTDFACYEIGHIFNKI